MSENGAVGIADGSKDKPFRADNFSLAISGDGRVGLTFKDADSDLVTVLLTPEVADTISVYLAPDHRQQLWEAAKQRAERGLN